MYKMDTINTEKEETIIRKMINKSNIRVKYHCANKEIK